MLVLHALRRITAITIGIKRIFLLKTAPLVWILDGRAKLMDKGKTSPKNIGLQTDLVKLLIKNAQGGVFGAENARLVN